MFNKKLLKELIDQLLAMPDESEVAPVEGDGLAVEKTEVKALTDGEELPLEDDEAMAEALDTKKKKPFELEA